MIIDVDRRYNLSDDIRIKLDKLNNKENNIFLKFTIPQISNNFMFVNDIYFKLFKYIRLYLQDIYLRNKLK